MFANLTAVAVTNLDLLCIFQVSGLSTAITTLDIDAVYTADEQENERTGNNITGVLQCRVVKRFTTPVDLTAYWLSAATDDPAAV